MNGKKIVILLLTIAITIIIIAIISVYSINKTVTDELNLDLLKLMKNSNLVKDKIGEIETIDKANLDWFKKYDNNGSICKDYIVKVSTNEEIIIKIILNPKVTKGIYAYEINGEIFYEEIINDSDIHLNYFVEK